MNISITGTRIVFPHVQLSTIAPGVFFEQSKSTCQNDALQQILYWFLRRKFPMLGSESNIEKEMKFFINIVSYAKKIINSWVARKAMKLTPKVCSVV